MSEPAIFYRAEIEMEQQFHDLSPPEQYREHVRATESQTLLKIHSLQFLRSLDGVLYAMPNCKAHLAFFVLSDTQGDVLHAGLTLIDPDEKEIGSMTFPIDRADAEKIGDVVAGLFELTDHERAEG